MTQEPEPEDRRDQATPVPPAKEPKKKQDAEPPTQPEQKE
jgi:hypothetical protein